MNSKWNVLIIFALIMPALLVQTSAALATDCAQPAVRFIPQAPSAPTAETFIPQPGIVSRQTFRPYVEHVQQAQRPEQVVYAQPATRFYPPSAQQPQPTYVSPADREPQAQRFIPNPQILPEVERVRQCLCQ